MAAHVVKLDKVRADTTVVPANVAYPTDSGLLAKGVAKLTKTVAALHALGLARRTGFRDRTRSVRRRAHQIAAWLRRRSGDAKDEVLGLTGELATIAEAAIKDAQVVATNARRGLRRAGEGASGRAAALVAELERTIGVLDQVVVQTRSRLAGEVPDGATRVVSLHDTDARPIRKGRLGKPVEFGYKAQVTDNVDGIVVDHRVEKGNSPDAPMLVPAIARVAARFSKVPKAVTADRGYGEAKVETELESLGVKHVAIPRKGRPGAQRQAARVITPLSQADQVAHRIRRSHLTPQALLGMGTDDARRPRRSEYVVRLGRARAQCHQDLRAHRRTRTTQCHRRFQTDPPTHRHRTTWPTPANDQEPCRLTSFLPLPSRPRGRKRPENRGENDRRGWGEASGGPMSASTPERHLCLRRVFQVEVARVFGDRTPCLDCRISESPTVSE